MENVMLRYTKLSEAKKTAHIIWKEYHHYPRIMWFPWEHAFIITVSERIKREFLDKRKTTK